MPPNGVITLLTDFGADDPFVGVLKGVILSRFAQARIVDLAHGVRAQDVVEGAFWLSRTFRRFPEGTVHVAVVDPGVGTERAGVVVRGTGHLFVGPDNGLLAGLGERVRRIDTGKLGLPEPSATFHGRDVFAPVAADLASGRRGFEAVGPEARLEAEPALPGPEVADAEVRGIVVSVDHFGNLITNIDAELVLDWSSVRVRLGRLERPLVRTYADAPVGDFVAVVGSFGTIELAKRDGNAARALEAHRGMPVGAIGASR